jgi:hypothetical protein
MTIQQGIKNIVNKGFPNEKYSVIVIHDKTEVSYGIENDVNFEYCKEHDIPLLDLKRTGGAIVYFAGNVSWADVRPNNYPTFKTPEILFLKKLTAYLIEKGLNATLEDNDIMVDGYKVASGCSINLPPTFERTFSSAQICINCDLETIKNICLKPMNKTPKGLSEYGITTEEIEQFVRNYFTNNK